MPALATILHPIQPNWSNHRVYPRFLVPLEWADWLYDTGSLTQRLSALKPGTFNVEVLSERYGYPTPLESDELKLSSTERVWVREVILRLADQPMVYARTAIPFSTLKHYCKQLQGLGTRSLGSFLFSQPSLRRGQLYANRCATNAYGLDWCRRSVFSLKHHPLMVTEAFSQPFEQYRSL